MPTFRIPHPGIELEDPEALRKIKENFEELVNDYNRVLMDLDAEVFYHVIPIVTGEEPVAIGTFTPSHKIKVLIDEVEYYIQLDAV